MTKIITPTLAICLAGGIAAGIALARPATTTTSIAEASEPTVATGPSTVTADPGGLSRSEPIEIRDFSYNDITVAPGSIVEVRNIDGETHTVTAVGDEFDTGNVAGFGAATFAAPALAGSYAFFCTIHPSMQGTLTVN